MISKVQILRALACVAVMFSATLAYAADEPVVVVAEDSTVEAIAISGESDDIADAEVVVGQIEGDESEEVEFSVLREAFLFTFKGEQTDLDHTDERYIRQMVKLDTLLRNAPIEERDVVNVVASTSFNIYMSFMTHLSITSAFNLREKFLLDYPEVDPAQVKSYYYCNPWMSVADRLEANEDFVEREDILDIMRSNDNPYAIEYLLKALYSSSLDAWIFIDQAMSDITRYGLIFIQRDGLEEISPIYLNESQSVAERLPEDEDLAAVRESFDYVYESADEIIRNEDYFFVVAEEEVIEDEAVEEIVEEDEPAVIAEDEQIEEVVEDEDDGVAVFAFKTNLLFNLISVINGEIEVPIGDKFSIAGEVMFPWWVMDSGEASSNRNRLQTINGTIEARYWLGNREERARLTHWFLGAYAGFGVFDFEYDHIGYQSEKKFTNFGLSVGYAHQLAKRPRIRFEYSLGIGYMQTKFNKYEAVWSDLDNSWKAMRTETGSMGWFGPTRAKVSMSVAINKSRSKIEAKANAKIAAAEAKASARVAAAEAKASAKATARNEEDEDVVEESSESENNIELVR